MASSYSPPLLYLTDDDDEDETEHHIPHSNSFTSAFSDNFPHKKRKSTNANVRINPTIANWSKRQRHDNYNPMQTSQSFENYEHDRETTINHNDYMYRQPESHSFLAFDWSAEAQTPSRIYPNPNPLNPRLSSFAPPSNMINVAKRHLDQIDTSSLIPSMHQNDSYIQQPQRKLINIPMSSNSPPPLTLPLPSPTSSIIRPMAQRVPPRKNIPTSYTHPRPAPSLPVHHQPESIFQSRFHLSSPASIITPITTPEIRRQPLNGTGILSAFYDSKCYRCNICKFKSDSSTAILQHIFSHIFFCPQCPFYTYSHHSLYQHVFEKHNVNFHCDNTDPKNLDLLYVTRCSDGTFALCMDTSTPTTLLSPLPPPPPLLPLPPQLATKPDEQIVRKAAVNNEKPKRRTPRKKKPKKKAEDDDIVFLSEKHDFNSQPSSSSSLSSMATTIAARKPILTTAATTPKSPAPKEKQTHTYILMKHRRCYAVRNPPCLHALTLEYNICREHTIRHMCHTQKIFKRRNFKIKLHARSLINEIARCLKKVVNKIVNLEENRNSSDLVCLLPNNIISSILSIDDLESLTSTLKLNNKYDKFLEQKKLNESEYVVRANNHHNYILSATGINKANQSSFASFHTSAKSSDSIFTETIIDCGIAFKDNTYRFFQNNYREPTVPVSKPTKKKNSIQLSKESTNCEPMNNASNKSPRCINIPSISPRLDQNNSSKTSSKPKPSLAPSVIVLD
ncbi:unnamed protein product [Adineta steineri]|uniref:C2H2-type domain-containing protein n=1 Tax=Adineta steineri TaxID=433720 RepID=A0A819A407_9BILA|nr:unnamed protein product [Adineta steineri]